MEKLLFFNTVYKVYIIIKNIIYKVKVYRVKNFSFLSQKGQSEEIRILLTSKNQCVHVSTCEFREGILTIIQQVRAWRLLLIPSPPSETSHLQLTIQEIFNLYQLSSMNPRQLIISNRRQIFLFLPMHMLNCSNNIHKINFSHEKRQKSVFLKSEGSYMYIHY